jgi:hypothetical protein
MLAGQQRLHIRQHPDETPLPAFEGAESVMHFLQAVQADRDGEGVPLEKLSVVGRDEGAVRSNREADLDAPPNKPWSRW